MGACQQITSNKEPQKSSTQTIVLQNLIPCQLKLMPFEYNIVGDSDRMDDLYQELDKQVSINPINPTSTLQDNLFHSSKLQLTNDPQSSSFDKSQITKTSPKKRNLNAKFKEMVL